MGSHQKSSPECPPKFRSPLQPTHSPHVAALGLGVALGVGLSVGVDVGFEPAVWASQAG
jgi:hypothetical protein